MSASPSASTVSLSASSEASAVATVNASDTDTAATTIAAAADTTITTVAFSPAQTASLPPSSSNAAVATTDTAALVAPAMPSVSPDTRHMDFAMHAIGVIHTPYGEKFAVPRQPRLVESTHCTIELFAPYCDPQACIGLEGFSHIHVLFVFDQIPEDKFRPMIRPPRLGGNQRIGVFASRSPFRPNRIGLSLLQLEKVEVVKGKAVLQVKGADMVDGTPILDIKPYIPFVDAIADARGGFASDKPALKTVSFTPAARAVLTQAQARGELDEHVLVEILAQDPRPAYKGEADSKEYYALLMGYRVVFHVQDTQVLVTALQKATEAVRS